MRRKEEGNRGRDILVLVLCLGILITTAVAVWALFFRSSDRLLIPDYAPQETEPNAVPMDEQEENGVTVPQGGGAVSVEYAQAVTIDLSDAEILLQYANPARSMQDIVLQIVIQEQVVAVSGLVESGYAVGRLSLPETSAQMLQPGIYENAVFRILCYDPITGEKAMVNPEAEIIVTVCE